MARCAHIETEYVQPLGARPETESETLRESFASNGYATGTACLTQIFMRTVGILAYAAIWGHSGNS
jgi:hypothetical protein